MGEFLVFLGEDARVRPGFLDSLLGLAAGGKELGLVAPRGSRPQAIEEHCLLIPRGVFSALGGFDRRFERALWGWDFCFRARQRGLELVTAEPTLVTRDVSALNGDARPPAHDTGLLFGKWSGHPLFEAIR